MIAVALLVVVVSGWFAATHFAMSTDTAQLIDPRVEWRRDEIALDAGFPANRDLIAVVVDGATPEAAEIAAATLADRLARDRAHFRSVRRPDATPFLRQNGLLLGTTEDVRATTAALIAAQPFLGPLAADPSLRGVMTSLSTVLTGVGSGSARLVDVAKPVAALGTALTAVVDGRPATFSWINLFDSGSGKLKPPRRRIVVVQPVLDYGDLMPGSAASSAIHAAADGLDARVRLTGAVPLADEEFATLEDHWWLVAGVMLVAMLGILALAVRSARIVAAITLVTLAGLVVTTALGLATVGRFNLISVAFIPLFVGLGVDFGIQLSVRFRAEGAAGAASPAEALRDAGRGLGGALALAATAVALGFIAFLPTAYVGVSELGVIAAGGMVVALALNVTLLPALLVMLRPQPRGEPGLRLARTETWLLANRRSVLWTFGISLAVSIALLPLVVFDFNPYHLRDPNGPAMATLTDLARDPDRTPNTVEVLTREPATVAARLARLAEVRQVVTLDSFVPDEQPAKLALIADARDLLDLTLNPFDSAPPADDAATVAALRKVAAQLRTISATDPEATRLAVALERLASGPVSLRARADAVVTAPLDVLLNQTRSLLRADAVTRETLPADLRADWIARDGSARVEVFPTGDATDNTTLKRFATAVLTVAPHATGAAISTQAAAATIARAFVLASIYGIAAISLLLFVVLRNVREVAFTLAPVVLSGFLTLATCVIIGQPINFANIIAFPLLFGVGVAFHIYFVMAWRDGATGLLTSSLARAVLFSALATGTAFGSLWLSRHPGTASMGKILMISLAWTLVCALIFEPALLGPAKRHR